jgi:hypothetical protein
MTPTEAHPLRTGWSFGAGLLAVGLLALWLSNDIDATRLGDTRDPGARALPRILAAILIAGSVLQLAGWMRARLRAKAVGLPLRDAAEATATEPAASVDAVILLVATVVYIPLIAWAGFALSTTLFVIAIMIRLRARWLTAIATALGLVIVVHVLFVTLFRVQLPTGRLGLPF